MAEQIGEGIAFGLPEASRVPRGTLLSPEVEPQNVLIVGVLGPKAIGKTTILEVVKEKGWPVLSIGDRLRYFLKHPEEFTKFLIEKDVKYAEDGIDYTGEELIRLTKDRLGKGPVPQEVATAIAGEFIERSEEEVVFLSSGPHSKKDLQLLEKKHSRFAFVYLAPRDEKWRAILKTRIVDRNRQDDKWLTDLETEYAMAELEEEWKKREIELLRYIHRRGYPLLHIDVCPDYEPKLMKQLLGGTIIQFLERMGVKPSGLVS